MKKITIVGTGKMADTLINALKKSFDIEAIGRNSDKLKELKDRGIEAKNYDEFDSKDKIVILAVKPHALPSISKYFKHSAYLLISVLAGTKIEALKKEIKSKHYVRAMPNLAAKFKKSMTTLTGDEESKRESVKIFENIGNTLWLNSEKEIDIATAIAGSGPAFLAIVAEALMDGGVMQGLKREDANKLVRGLFEGFAPLLKNRHPAIIKEEVMSPAGTTAKGCASLEENRVRSAFIKAVEAAFNRTKN